MLEFKLAACRKALRLGPGEEPLEDGQCTLPVRRGIRCQAQTCSTVTKHRLTLGKLLPKSAGWRNNEQPLQSLLVLLTVLPVPTADDIGVDLAIKGEGSLSE
jgi:hypothetical protein